MGTSRGSVVYGAACLGVVITTLLAAMSAQAQNSESVNGADRPRINLPLNIATQNRSCSLRALRGQYGQPGSIDVFITLRCAHNWVLKARALSDESAASDSTEPLPVKASLWSLHVGRNSVMFSIGTKW
ncbi:MAG: hypothetical protein ACYDC8_14100 [Gammaproteobacteria bacterium]